MEAIMQKYVVEYAGIPVGILVPFEDSLKFVAVKFHVMALDGQLFASLADVRRAIQVHLTGAAKAAA
jgi:hypothetical protein